MPMYKLKIIIASTRPGRKGEAVGAWITELAKQQPDFEIEVLDLAVVNLPFLDEANHPRLRKYEKEHTKKWSETIDGADAFLFVTPEYNYGYPAPLKNAIDFLFWEWHFKPVAFVTYGGIAGGTRCQQMLKQVVTALSMMPVNEAVNVPSFAKFLTQEGKFEPDEVVEKSAGEMFKSLLKWTTALAPMRQK